MRTLVVLTLTLAIGSLAQESSVANGTPAAPPDTITYQTWFGGGSRVEFSHSLHADMFGLSCSECHHAENCRSCHESQNVTALATNSRIALHGVCFRCHEQGATLEGCDTCHLRENKEAGYSGVQNSAKPDPAAYEQVLKTLTATREKGELNIVGEALPFERQTPSPPKEHIFLASQETGVSLVYFPHTAHAEDYNISCASCHHMESCSHCHQKANAAIQVSSARAALMDHCISCHEQKDLRTGCDSCHQDPHPAVNRNGPRSGR